MRTCAMAIELINFARKHKKPFLYAIPVVLFFAFIDMIFDGILFSDKKSLWSVTINPWVNILTFVIAFTLWLAEVYRDWKENLPKRLTVLFRYRCRVNERYKVVMRCKKAHISDWADVRALGQQIGSQLVNPDNPDRKLSFIAPHVAEEEKEVQYDLENGFYIHQHVTFTLTKLPEGIIESECKVWRHPFTKEDITIEKHE